MGANEQDFDELMNAVQEAIENAMADADGARRLCDGWQQRQGGADGGGEAVADNYARAAQPRGGCGREGRTERSPARRAPSSRRTHNFSRRAPWQEQRSPNRLTLQTFNSLTL